MRKIFTITILLTALIVNSLKAEYTQYFDESTVPAEITPADSNNVANFRIEDDRLVFDIVAGNWASVGPLINIDMPVEDARGEMLRFKVYSHTGSSFTAGVRATFIIDGDKVVYNQNMAGMQGLWNRNITPAGTPLEFNLDSIIRGYELQHNDGNTFNDTIGNVLIEFGTGSDVTGKTIAIDNIEIGVIKVEALNLSATRIVQGEDLELMSPEEGQFYLTGWSNPKVELNELKRIAETKYGIQKESKPGETVIFNTETLHPGVYNASIVCSGSILQTKEIVIAYPEDYVFDLKEPSLFGIKNAWVGWEKARAYNKHYSVVAVEGSAYWNELQPAENQFDFSSIDELLDDCAYTQKPVILKINVPTPEWMFDYVAHVGGLSPIDENGNGGGITRRGSKAPQFWSPVYIAYYKKLLDALANHVGQSPKGRWMLGLRINPMAFNEEAWFYGFNGEEMELAGITPDRSTWIPPRDTAYSIYEPKLEANNFEQAKSYFKEIISYHQKVFHPNGIYTFLRPYLEVDADLNLDCSSYFENEYTVAMGTDGNAGKQKPANKRGQVFKKYARNLKKGAFHEDTWASFKAEEWNAKHGREPNYNLIPRSAEMAIYWRQFLKLYEGVTMSAFGASELLLLDNPAYQAAVDLFLKYSGGEMDVMQTQYAWMVFAEYTDWNLVPQFRNVGYWLTEDNTSKTEISTETSEDGDYRSFHLASLTGDETSLTVAPEFVQSHTGRAVVSIEWKAASGDAWELYSDGEKMGRAESTSEGFVTNTFEHTSVPENLTIRKISGNPKFHIVEVAKLAADTSGQVSPSGISISACPIEDLIIGDDYQFQAIVLPLDAADKSVTWTSSDTTVATVDSTGFVSTQAVGNAYIRVTANDVELYDECLVFVDDSTASTAISSMNLKSDIQVFPNPASSQLSIVFPHSNIEKKIQLFNLSGSLLLEKKTRQQKLVVDIDNLDTESMLLVKLVIENKTELFKIQVLE